MISDIALPSGQIQLVEQHRIWPTDPRFEEAVRLCWLSKNVCNSTLYAVRQAPQSYVDLARQFAAKNQPDFRALPAKVAQQSWWIRPSKASKPERRRASPPVSQAIGRLVPSSKHKSKLRYVTLELVYTQTLQAVESPPWEDRVWKEVGTSLMGSLHTKGKFWEGKLSFPLIKVQ